MRDNCEAPEESEAEAAERVAMEQMAEAAARLAEQEETRTPESAHEHPRSTEVD